MAAVGRMEHLLTVYHGPMLLECLRRGDVFRIAHLELGGAGNQQPYDSLTCEAQAALLRERLRAFRAGLSGGAGGGAGGARGAVAGGEGAPDTSDLALGERMRRAGRGGDAQEPSREQQAEGAGFWDWDAEEEGAPIETATKNVGDVAKNESAPRSEAAERGVGRGGAALAGARRSPLGAAAPAAPLPTDITPWLEELGFNDDTQLPLLPNSIKAAGGAAAGSPTSSRPTAAGARGPASDSEWDLTGLDEWVAGKGGGGGSRGGEDAAPPLQKRRRLVKKADRDAIVAVAGVGAGARTPPKAPSGGALGASGGAKRRLSGSSAGGAAAGQIKRANIGAVGTQRPAASTQRNPTQPTERRAGGAAAPPGGRGEKALRPQGAPPSKSKRGLEVVIVSSDEGSGSDDDFQ